MRIAFLTGAGMSAESGIPTFRDALTGLWARFDAEQLATEAAFRRDPGLVWGWYRWRAAAVGAAAPNAGHLGIAALQDTHDVAVVTQNVDDLHERAGSRGVTHLHGSLFASRCLDCAAVPRPDPILAGLADAAPPVGAAMAAMSANRRSNAIAAMAAPTENPGSSTDGRREAPPRCVHCAGPIRPGVVWFGESLPADAWRTAEDAIDACEWLVVVGTSGLVHPAAALPALARDAGRRVIEINPASGAISRIAHEHWPLGAAAGIARLSAMLAG